MSDASATYTAATDSSAPSEPASATAHRNPAAAASEPSMPTSIRAIATVQPCPGGEDGDRDLGPQVTHAYSVRTTQHFDVFPNPLSLSVVAVSVSRGLVARVCVLGAVGRLWLEDVTRTVADGKVVHLAHHAVELGPLVDDKRRCLL